MTFYFQLLNAGKNRIRSSFLATRSCEIVSEIEIPFTDDNLELDKWCTIGFDKFAIDRSRHKRRYLILLNSKQTHEAYGKWSFLDTMVQVLTDQNVRSFLRCQSWLSRLARNALLLSMIPSQ